MSNKLKCWLTSSDVDVDYVSCHVIAYIWAKNKNVARSIAMTYDPAEPEDTDYIYMRARRCEGLDDAMDILKPSQHGEAYVINFSEITDDVLEILEGLGYSSISDDSIYGSDCRCFYAKKQEALEDGHVGWIGWTGGIREETAS